MNDSAAVAINTEDRELKSNFTQAPVASAQTLRDSVETALNNYFSHLDGQPVTEVYDMVLAEVEAPLLERVMQYTRNNQTKASIILGLNRGTLRKKLKQYDLL
ncbi:DNA-binding protein Fis [Sinobacterium norvegicum]|uniref:Putative Fis-like DNA-binding protein n=1 Tax=Sinobacterium norvegicum TaxID=1641715 RepID=A0ABM9AEJ0_9GAMM|nr:DNA-binding transcriptional regulator Fis [Sinobacterium norvegicum]CAH0991462.1 DNA-binding protein Fis [Sinobacterium norvegicum]